MIYRLVEMEMKFVSNAVESSIARGNFIIIAMVNMFINNLRRYLRSV